MNYFHFVTSIAAIIALFSAMIYCIYKGHPWVALFFGIITFLVIENTKNEVDEEFEFRNKEIDEYNEEVRLYNEKIEESNEDIELDE